MIGIVIAGVLVGNFYWNDQLSFGMNLPSGYQYCDDLTGGPDRGVNVILRNSPTCADIAGAGVEYIRMKSIPNYYVTAWYNTPEEFSNSKSLAISYCYGKKNNNFDADHSDFFEKKINGRVWFFCKSGGDSGETIRGFFQLDSSVNIEVGLRNTYMSHLNEYLASIKSFRVKKN